MSDNWVVQNLENALETWNEKLAEIWQLITQSPEQFNAGQIAHQLDDSPPCFFRLFAVFLDVGEDDLMHSGRAAFRVAFGGKHTKLRIGSRPVSHAPKQTIGLAVLLDPYKSHRLIRKAPCTHDRKAVVQQWDRCP